MFNLIINWLKIIKENIPLDLHTNYLFDWMKVLISPFNKIYTESMQAYEIFVIKIAYTGQVIYLEKILNDKFSPISGGIYIQDGTTLPKYYLYNKIETKPPRYLYMNWQPTTAYLAGEFSVKYNKVWKALNPNTNSIPSAINTDWVFHKDIEFLRTNAEFNITYNFIVMVPVALVYNTIEMKAVIDFYRLAGLRYKIQTY